MLEQMVKQRFGDEVGDLVVERLDARVGRFRNKARLLLTHL
jgi:hypothetical protein